MDPAILIQFNPVQEGHSARSAKSFHGRCHDTVRLLGDPLDGEDSLPGHRHRPGHREVVLTSWNVCVSSVWGHNDGYSGSVGPWIGEITDHRIRLGQGLWQVVIDHRPVEMILEGQFLGGAFDPLLQAARIFRLPPVLDRSMRASSEGGWIKMARALSPWVFLRFEAP